MGAAKAIGYVRPEDVVSPKLFWTLFSVLYDGGPGKQSIALGKWRGEVTLAIRTNGTNNEGEFLGNPQQRGISSWLILDSVFVEPLLSSGLLSKENLKLARHFFPEKSVSEKKGEAAE